MVLEALLHKGPLTISEIQAKLLLASGSMTSAVDRVESMGLVIRKTTATDRRGRVLELTPKGRRVIERAFAEHVRHLENTMSVLDADERRRLHAGLKTLGQHTAATQERPSSGRPVNSPPRRKPGEESITRRGRLGS